MLRRPARKTKRNRVTKTMSLRGGAKPRRGNLQLKRGKITAPINMEYRKYSVLSSIFPYHTALLEIPTALRASE